MRLEFTREVLAHVALAGLAVPVPLLSRTNEGVMAFEGRYYLLADEPAFSYSRVSTGAESIVG